MEQNRTHAVMAQRHHDVNDALDDYPTPPWATRAGVIHALYRDDVPFSLPPWHELVVWDPAANRGHMVRPLREVFGTVHASDVHDYGADFPVEDFLFPAPPRITPDLVITNPPFKVATQFVRRAMRVSRLGCAVLVRGTWMETHDRHRLFTEIPPSLIAQFVERVPMIGGYIADDATTATAYAWVVFLHGHTDTRWRHIPPCRASLERPGDYPSMDEQARSLGTAQLLRLLERHEQGRLKGGAVPPMPEAVIRAELARRQPVGGVA